MKNKEVFWATIGWDGCDEETEGEYTFTRYNIDHIVEDIIYYLDKWKTRSPYLVCSAHEINGEEKEITKSVKKYIETINKRG